MDRQLEAEFLKIRKGMLQLLSEAIKEVAKKGGAATARERLYQLPPDHILESCWRAFIKHVDEKIQYGIRHINGGNIEINAWRVYSMYGMMLYHLSTGCFPLEALLLVMNGELVAP